MKETECRNCKFFQKLENGYVEDDLSFYIYGLCRRYPPTSSVYTSYGSVKHPSGDVVPVENCVNSLYRFPNVSGDEYCGEFNMK